MIDRTTRQRVSFKIFEAESIWNYEHETAEPSYTTLDLEEKLSRVVQLLNEGSGQRVLFIVDEFDRVRETSGIASYIKNASTESFRFMLVGISQSLAELISDHRSLDRIAAGTEVERMPVSELIQVVERAMARLEAEDLGYSFEPAAAIQFAIYAGGYPWFVHVIGQAALSKCADADETVVTVEPPPPPGCCSTTPATTTQSYDDSSPPTPSSRTGQP